jgi:hypothetical protein
VPKEILFPEVEPRYDFERDRLAFPASVDDKPLECLVSLELLMSRFGAREPGEEPTRQAYQEHKAEIQAIARHHIEMGWVSKDNVVLLTTRFTTLKITFGESLQARPREHKLALEMMTLLKEMVGPQAGEVSVEVDWEEKDGRRRIVVIFDEGGGVANWFEPKDGELSKGLRGWIASLWGDLLQMRSHKLLQRWG